MGPHKASFDLIRHHVALHEHKRLHKALHSEACTQVCIIFILGMIATHSFLTRLVSNSARPQGSPLWGTRTRDPYVSFLESQGHLAWTCCRIRNERSVKP